MRPIIEKDFHPEEFIKYYWLKKDLINFCRYWKLSRTGSKSELTLRIYEYLKTGKIVLPEKNKHHVIRKNNSKISLDTIIPEHYKNDERHRNFFKSKIGKHFKFNVQFMNWMKGNSGKTYQDAISEYKKITQKKKQGIKTVISSQFEYNQYIRDFFDANRKASLKDAIQCWKYKKSLPGQNKYDIADLNVIKK